jgi:hypothetical protein
VLALAEGADGSDHGCRFAPRCPAAMAICRDSPPPLFRVYRRRAAACYLYRDSEVVAGRDIGTILDQEDDLAPERVGVEERPD